MEFHRIYDMRLEQDRGELSELRLARPEIKVFDQIKAQVSDLIKSKQPSRKFLSHELEAEISRELGSEDSDLYGTWVFYPWSDRLVHLLYEEDFVHMRTDRNRYKITPEEQDIMSKKVVGLVGLSVGHAVAMTMSMERSFGALRIADFDVLDLSNLNRIRSTVHQIGIPKTSLVIQEIAELDPFLKVIPYNEGVREENMDEFLEGLDLLIDECDSIDIKILLREKAKALHIPVIMETSDRGMLDIERFDLDHDLPILHGLVEGLDSAMLKELSNEEKIPYVLPIIGLDKSSVGLRASMVEIERSISTWPQLAADVTLGGGSVAYAARRIFLNQSMETGRYYLDLENLISPSLPSQEAQIEGSATDNTKRPNKQQLIHQKIKDLDVSAAVNDIREEVISSIIQKAAQAPSGGNVQPWLWHVRKNLMFLIMDTDKGQTFLNHRQRGSLLALGAAIKNVELAASHHGLHCQVSFPAWQEEESYPVIAICQLDSVSDSNENELFQFITQRVTNRLNEGKHPLPEGFKEQLIKKYQGETLQLHVLEAEEEILLVKEALSIADRLIMMNERGHKDLYNELVWDEDFSETEGINVYSLGLTPLEMAGMRIAKEEAIIQKIRELEAGERFKEMNHKCVDSSSALSLVTIPNYSAESYLDLGNMVQDIWLQCTAQNISMHPMSGMTFLINSIKFSQNKDLDHGERKDLLHCESLLRRAFNLTESEELGFLFRWNQTKQQPIPSNRRPIKDIMV